MIVQLRSWTAVQRTAQSNLRLGVTLSFVAGADNLVPGQVTLALAAFLGGALS